MYLEISKKSWFYCILRCICLILGCYAYVFKIQFCSLFDTDSVVFKDWEQAAIALLHEGQCIDLCLKLPQNCLFKHPKAHFSMETLPKMSFAALK